MNILQIYQKYNIPKHLQKHMFRVASVGKYIAENFKEEINVEDVISVLLLHDLGNLLKFDLGKGMALFDESEQDQEHWFKIQNKLKSLYSDEHTATLLMAKEIGISERILYLLENIGSSNLHKTLKMDDWELKVCSYSDFRVTPEGFTSVKDRFFEIMKRYDGRDHILADKEKTEIKMNYCLELETQIQEVVTNELSELPISKLEEQLKSLVNFEI